MTITRNNCEAAFLDYYEQTLSPVEVAEVLFFLEENPDLKDVFESYKAIFLEHEKVNFPDKESLKKKYSKEEIDIILSSGININNYEQFFVASAEGILSSPQTQKTNAFLAQNPELQKEFDLIQKCKLPAEKVKFEHKDLLKKETINAQNREEYFVRSVEEDLTSAEQKQLTAFLQKNPQFKKELEAFRQTVLVPEKISFEFKSELKKRERKPVFVVLSGVEGFQRSTYYAAAAAILLLMGLFFIFRSNDNNGTYLANKTDHTSKTVNVNTPKENSAPIEKNEVIIPRNNEPVNNSAVQINIKKNISASKNSMAPAPEVKEEKIIPPAVVLPENKSEENPIAKKEEQKKAEQAPVEAPAIAKNPAPKADSVAAPTVQNQVVASAVKATPIAIGADDGYQTVASAVNKKIRSVLGIKKATECETSDRIGLWDLAMVVKRGLQNRFGTNAVDMNKVCDGANGKVEYVFAAGNFEISKSASR